MRRTFIIFSFLLSLLATPLLASAQTSQVDWHAFIQKPTLKSHQSLSRSIHDCIIKKCQSNILPDEDTFYNLLKLVKNGNRYALDVAFQIHPFYQDNASSSEDLDRSMGMSITLNPRFFLEEAKKYSFSDKELSYIAPTTSESAIDNLEMMRREQQQRIRALYKVKERNLLELRNRLIAMIQSEIDEYSKLPNNALGK